MRITYMSLTFYLVLSLYFGLFSDKSDDDFIKVKISITT